MNKKFLPMFMILLTSCSLSNKTPKEENNEEKHNDQPETAQKYLPSSISYLDVATNKVSEQVSFEYDDDYLGYTQTREIDDDDKTKYVKTVRFSSDFSSYDWEQIEYKYKNSEYVISFRTKGSFLFYENSSYKEASYNYDNDSSSYVFSGERCHEYNKLGQETLNSVKIANSDKPGEFYYSTYITTEYNEAGYPLKVTDYDHDRTPEKNLYVNIVNEYVYNNDFTECTINDLYFNRSSGQLVRDGYTKVAISEDALGRKTFNEQIYSESGSKGNQNIKIYDKNWKTLYNYYGGFPESTAVSFNDKDQLTDFLFVDGYENEVVSINVSYKDDLISKTEMIKDDDSYTSNCECIYSYNDVNQLSFVDVSNVFASKKDISNNECNATKISVVYSDKVNDKLLSNMDYLEEIFNQYTQNYIDRYFRLF